jgi:hypothetical protein
MEKVLQEFRIIETEDGFRIEIKGDKDKLRDFVMGLDPRHWMHHDPPMGRGFPFGPFGLGGRRMHFGPFRMGWDWCEDWDDEDDEPGPRRKRRRRHGGGHGHGHGHHGHGHGHHDHEPHDAGEDEVV